MDRETRLGILASAILERKRVDWDAAGSSADPADRAVVRQLQIVAEIAALHRSVADLDSQPAAEHSVDQTTLPGIAWGHLQLLEMVGRGTFGEVYRAWDTHLDREVALKLLRATRATGDPSVSISDPSRVVHEGRLLARVRHPHVITVYGAEPRDGRVGIWMEFIRGRTLHQVVHEQGSLGAREAAAVGTDLCQALAAVHRAGLLHRDVTARNVIREDGGRVVLMDFGAGHDYEPSATRLGSDVTGTPLYMAPELFVGQRADQRTDIYALGVLLYFLVTGSYPVTGRSLEEIGNAHRRGERARLRDARANLPAPFVRAVEKATMVDPAERCQTAGDFEAMLAAALVGTREATLVRRGGQWRLAAPLLALIAVLAAVATTGTLPAWRLTPAANTPSGGTPATPPAAAATHVALRKLVPPTQMSSWSNPSADGRYLAGMINETGDIGIADLATGQYRALGMGRGDWSDGYASTSALSPDGTAIAVDWHDDERGSLRVIRADGSGRRVLIDTAADVAVHEWSRDQSLIVAVIADGKGSNTVALVATADGAVRPLRQIGDTLPAKVTLSPDGRYLAYDYPEPAHPTDRDIFIIDTHTGRHAVLVASAGDDSMPLWSPKGGELLFFSDRNRTFSAWSIRVDNGRAQGEPRLVKDDVRRVWPGGFTANGALYHLLAAGFAEVYIADITAADAGRAPLSPRQALSNFYPRWSPDGRLVAYASERRVGSGRELWVYDTTTGGEHLVPSKERLDVPFGWSPDGHRILARASGDALMHIIERAGGHVRATMPTAGFAHWTSGGIITPEKKAIALYDADTGRRRRLFERQHADAIAFALALDGRSILEATKQGRLILRDVITGGTREWHDGSATRIAGHVTAPHTSAVAYSTSTKDAIGEVMTLKVWGGLGDPRQLLSTRAPERFFLTGWTPDGQDLLVVRWTQPPTGSGRGVQRTLWRVPASGAAPRATALTMEGLRDVSINPDGRRIAFNAGWKFLELWVMENLLQH